MHKDHLQDKASRILKDNLSRQFTVNSSVLSEEEILARLTSAEEGGESAIMSGVVAFAQLSQVQ